MEKNLDHRKIANIISDMYVLSGIRAAILDEQGRGLCPCPGQSRFCELIQSTPEGRERCTQCSLNMIKKCQTYGSCVFQRCHAGLLEGAIPVQEEDTVLFLLFGQYLDSTDYSVQWNETAERLDWYPGDKDRLREAFYMLRQYSAPQITAYLGLVRTLKKYVYSGSSPFSPRYSDRERLEQYLNEHYMEKLSLNSISEDLGIGRTKLCALAKTLPGGQTISQLITQRRIQEACVLLLQTDLAISDVSERVGISDYNYFSKVFRLATGLTPSAYRRAEVAVSSPAGRKQ